MTATRDLLGILLLLQNGTEHLLALAARRLLVEHSGLDDFLVDVEFVLGSCQDALLHRVDGQQSQHAHLVLLPDPVRAVLRLQILVRVPVGVEDDDRVGRLQVQTETARARRQDEDEVLRVGRVELLEHLSAIVRASRAVQTQVLVI